MKDATDTATAINRDHDEALDRLRAAVREARKSGVSQAELVRITKRHRNTIAAWCEGLEQ